MSHLSSDFPIRRVVIWGASLSGSDCLHKYQQQNIEVAYFVDRRVRKAGLFCGVALYPVDHLLKDTDKNFDAVILAMSVDPSGPRHMLDAAGIEQPVFSFRQGTEVSTEVKSYLSPNLAIRFDNSDEDLYFLRAIKDHINSIEGDVAIFSSGPFAEILLQRFPELLAKLKYRVSLVEIPDSTLESSLTPLNSRQFAKQNIVIIIGETGYLETERASRLLKQHYSNSRLITLSDVFKVLPHNNMLKRASISIAKNIYPIDIPEIKLNPDIDFALLDLPPRFYSMMPNGLGYVHNTLEKANVNVQTLDLDLIFYHRFHTRRIFDGLDSIKHTDGYQMKQDPWSIDVISDEWLKFEVIEYFNHEIDQLIAAIVDAKPMMIGFSLHGANLKITIEVIKRIRVAYPEGIIIVGGYDCIRPEIGLSSITDFDYMVIFEAEVSLPQLVNKLLAGERPNNLPGIIAKNDRAELPFVPAALFQNLDAIPFPRYQWTEIENYRNYNGYHVTPIVLSRGCRWSRCTFCAERYTWRRRNPKKVIEEIEWFAKHGRNTFVFNDSDLSGDPTAVQEICEEIINRNIKGITLSGQLRVQKGYTQEYFNILSQAGFNTLTYGIDGWSKNTLKLHKKGYTIPMVEEVLRFTANAGITASINLVIGIPYETEQDIDETIENILKNKDYVDGIENLNTIILSTGSVYWEQPEKFGIHFRGDKDKLYRKNAGMIPTDSWYSVDPYIDQAIRLSRVRRIVEAVKEAGVRIGSYAEWNLMKLQSA